jgi:hypothetical protein
MNANNLSHPKTEDWAAFASGQVSEAVAEEFSRHLADCARCRTLVETLPDDTLLSLLRQPAPLEEAATGPAPPRPQAPAVPPALVGNDRYEVLELLGSGGMGAVYKAQHRRMERLVALKVISPTLVDRPDMVERFGREVKAAARLAHPNIVTAFDADQVADTHFLVMEFVEGTSLAQQVEQHGQLPVAVACDYVRQAALGLQHAFEQGMVHRDVKPHNLMVTPGGRVKILDFGLARFVRETASARPAAAAEAGPPGPLTGAGMVMGTADFIAPEQAADPGGSDIRADVYSLGCTLYYLLAGHAPFPEGTAQDKLLAHAERTARPLTELRGDVPPRLTQVVDRMMAKDPADRYQTPAEAADALAPFIREARPPHRYLRRLGIAAAACAAVALAAAIIYVQTDKGRFVIEAENDSIAVAVDAKGVKVRNLDTKQQYLLTVGPHRLPSGEYAIDVTELPEGVVFTTDQFTLKRGDKVTVRARLEGMDRRTYLLDEGLAWFPADATFFGGRDVRVFPELSVQQLLVLTQLIDKIEPRQRDRFLAFVALVGQIDRVTFAFTADKKQRARSRFFIRATGSISHQRLAGWLRQEWPGAVVTQEKGPRGEAITLVASSQPVGPAFALVGTTDLLMAGYHGDAQKHLEVVREALELRAGHGITLPAILYGGPPDQAMKAIPDNAWAFLAGQPPNDFQRLPLFTVLPQSVVLSVSGTRSVTFQWQASFATAADATAFADNFHRLRQKGIDFLRGPLVRDNAAAAALLIKTFDGLEVKAAGGRVGARLEAPGEALEAMTQVVRDLPLSLFRQFFAPADKR